MLPRVFQIEFKIKEKSTPKQVLEEFCETLIFYYSIMAFRDYSMSRDPKIHEKSGARSESVPHTILSIFSRFLEPPRPPKIILKDLGETQNPEENQLF